nr:uncharacterized protein LOC121118656 [Lepeophtheirus salmonis]
MRVPAVVESGREPHVILDCDYDIGDNEGSQIDVKWYFKDDPQPFYQWLPGRNPQTIGDLFKGRIDLSFVVDEKNGFKRHRAIKIIRPTTELSGTYRCKVSSFVDEDFETKRMTVYSPAQDLKLYYTKPDSRRINLTCKATGVYPKPEVSLTWGPLANQRGETTTLTVERDGLFDISVHKILLEEKLKPETVFGCILSIPDTSYTVKEETMYFPGKVLNYRTNTSTSSVLFEPKRFLLLQSTLLWILHYHFVRYQ